MRRRWMLFAVLLLGSACTHDGTVERAAGKLRRDAHGIEQVWVPAGRFTMGSRDDQIAAVIAQAPPRWVLGELASEQPAHDVTLTRGYWIDRTEVTNRAYEVFVAAGGYDDPRYWSPDGWRWRLAQPARTLPSSCGAEQPAQPRVCVTWFEADAYARWRGARLPSEAEWEYAARGPDARLYPWGDDFDPAVANVVGRDSLTLVDSFAAGASWVGAVDMAGNAMEWVQDWLGPAYYARAPARDPQGPETGTHKVEKGGWWGSNRWVARSAYRHYEDPPDYQDRHIGFRCVTPAAP